MRYGAAIFFFALFFFHSVAYGDQRPQLQLANVYHKNVDIRRYWISEKLDGVRAYWDGHHLISRAGTVFRAPPWFVAGFPAEPMDGELWIARGQFERVSGIVRQLDPNNRLWREVKLMIFDLPLFGGDFTARIARMKLLVAQADSAHLDMIEQFRLDGPEALFKTLDAVVAAGGEGLMLHRDDSYYHFGRSNDLLKLKQYLDAEAVVLQQLLGKGKYHGMMGALLVKNAEGQVFKIGSGFSDKERQNPPPVGAVITYKYYGKTKNGKPRFAVFMRIRQSR